MLLFKKIRSIIAKNSGFLIWCFFLVGLLIVLILIVGLQEDKLKWYAQVIGALLGAAIVATITYALLKGQAKTESDADQKKKVFENRMQAYEDFLANLREVVIRNEVSDEEEKRLQFGVALIGMHTTSDRMLRISKDLKKIVQKIRVEDPVDGSIWSEIIDIVQVFQSSLYNEDAIELEKNSELIKALRNFKGICAGENQELLEYIECALSQFNFDTHIADNCLFINIHIRDSVYKNLQSITGLNDKTPYRLYVTLKIENQINDKCEGFIAIYTGKNTDKQKIMANAIYNYYWKDPESDIRKKSDFTDKPFDLGVMKVNYAYVLSFKNRDKRELQAIVIEVLRSISELWDEPGSRYLCLRFEKNEGTGNNEWVKKMTCFTPKIESEN